MIPPNLRYSCLSLFLLVSALPAHADDLFDAFFKARVEARTHSFWPVPEQAFVTGSLHEVFIQFKKRYGIVDAISKSQVDEILKTTALYDDALIAFRPELAEVESKLRPLSDLYAVKKGKQKLTNETLNKLAHWLDFLDQHNIVFTGDRWTYESEYIFEVLEQGKHDSHLNQEHLQSIIDRLEIFREYTLPIVLLALHSHTWKALVSAKRILEMTLRTNDPNYRVTVIELVNFRLTDLTYEEPLQKTTLDEIFYLILNNFTWADGTDRRPFLPEIDEISAILSAFDIKELIELKHQLYLGLVPFTHELRNEVEKSENPNQQKILSELDSFLKELDSPDLLYQSDILSLKDAKHYWFRDPELIPTSVEDEYHNKNLDWNFTGPGYTLENPSFNKKNSLVKGQEGFVVDGNISGIYKNSPLLSINCSHYLSGHPALPNSIEIKIYEKVGRAYVSQVKKLDQLILRNRLDFPRLGVRLNDSIRRLINE